MLVRAGRSLGLTLALCAFAAAPGCSVDTAAPPPAATPLERACDELCATDCAHPGCTPACRLRFGASCDDAATTMLVCAATQHQTTCAPSDACSDPAADYATCRGALDCLSNLACEPHDTGCSCATSCGEFSVTATCDPTTGDCTCRVQGPLGVSGDATVEHACHTEQPTNKWCISQPFGCCEALF